MTKQITFDTQLREMCDRYGFRVDMSFPEGWVKFYWEDGVVRYLDDSLSVSLFRFIREYRDIDVDFFEWYQIPPLEVREIMDRYIKDGMSYDECSEFRDELEAVGWRFDYYLDAVPYNLRPIL
jgi:hypothetical protein